MLSLSDGQETLLTTRGRVGRVRAQAYRISRGTGARIGNFLPEHSRRCPKRKAWYLPPLDQEQ
ncbi:hypothetical protein ABH15_11900 [Methanoculleus taiwanensis]|uniref:Uncharacterized protein n=1 Tax=Methanoculleus taiwanensis TaxID=1550565 RepID=A0A498H0P8_9EURY|nr:hypothetical protein ABH15_11900 [Methanoculleus taiwanensis]